MGLTPDGEYKTQCTMLEVIIRVSLYGLWPRAIYSPSKTITNEEQRTGRVLHVQSGT
jgi:hypothetical protein